jgi:hypothetical protein
MKRRHAAKLADIFSYQTMTPQQRRNPNQRNNHQSSDVISG